jgi:hypothetical protein
MSMLMTKLMELWGSMGLDKTEEVKMAMSVDEMIDKAAAMVQMAEAEDIMGDDHLEVTLQFDKDANLIVPPVTPFEDLLATAAKERRYLFIEYADYAGVLTQRKVLPLAVTPRYALSLCTMRYEANKRKYLRVGPEELFLRSLRCFRKDRIIAAIPMDLAPMPVVQKGSTTVVPATDETAYKVGRVRHVSNPQEALDSGNWKVYQVQR